MLIKCYLILFALVGITYSNIQDDYANMVSTKSHVVYLDTIGNKEVKGLLVRFPKDWEYRETNLKKDNSTVQMVALKREDNTTISSMVVSSKIGVNDTAIQLNLVFQSTNTIITDSLWTKINGRKAVIISGHNNGERLGQKIFTSYYGIVFLYKEWQIGVLNYVGGVKSEEESKQIRDNYVPVFNQIFNSIQEFDYIGKQDRNLGKSLEAK